MINKLMNYLDNSVSSFHGVELLKKELINNGYIEINEKFDLDKNHNKYFIVKNDSSLIAFNIAHDINEDYGYMISATHTDFPQYKIKPKSFIKNGNYCELNTEPYGGMISSTWMDRPLGIAGRIFYKNENGEICKELVNEENLLVIPNLAIHLNREQNGSLNPQIHMLPIVSNTEIFDLNKLFGHELLSHDLYLYNSQKSVLVGSDKNFLMSQRIDNLESTYLCFSSFLNVEPKNNVNVFACFDNEEVGSRTINGADSTFLDDVLREINAFLGVNKYGYALSNSFIVSCDNAHSFHPNYQGQYDPTNRVHINEGIAIKYNANGSYTTSGISSAVFKSILDSANVKYQEFTNRSDSRGGGTLGSISLSHVSINSVDIGLPQYAMHSAYETCGVKDAYELVSGMTKFYGSKILINKKDNKIVIK